MTQRQSEAKRGTRNPRAKLTEEQVVAILKIAKRGFKRGEKAQIARRCQVTPQTITKLLKGQSWQNFE